MSKTTYVWDELSDNVIEEYEDGVLSASYTHEPGIYGNLLTQNRNGVTSYFHFNGRGDAVALTDDSGNVTDTKEYDAWGNVIATTGSTNTPYQFVGRKCYASLGAQKLSIARSRVVHPLLGRWISLDPSRFKDGPNLYCYVQNSPLLYADPTGLYSADTGDLGCKDLSPKELMMLEKCDRGDPCNCGVQMADPFDFDWDVIATIKCKDGVPAVAVNIGIFYPLPAQLELNALKETFRNAGILDCFLNHEMHHIAQYNCFCPGVCRGVPDGITATVTVACRPAFECFAYAGHLGCMISAACAVFPKQFEDPSTISTQIFLYIMDRISLIEKRFNLNCQAADLRDEDLLKNRANLNRLVKGQPCEPIGRW